MKKHVKIIHRLVAYLGIEGFFVAAKKYLPWLIKFIPLHTAYKKAAHRLVKRDGVFFNVLLSDYMQWYVFADIEDLSWRKATQYVANNSIIIDVGANCGAFALKLAQYAHKSQISNFKIYAFEPNPLVFEQLTDNLQLNPNLQAYVYPVNLGLGDKDATLNMIISADNTGGGAITTAEGLGEVQISVTSLDKFAGTENLTDVKFIKIDVEGFESLVLAGAENSLKKWLPGIHIEITDEWLQKHGSSQNAIIDYFTKLGYELYVEKNDKFVPIVNAYNYISNIFQYNLLAVLPKNS
ncbi:hypothetical protein BEL04_07120 [Mucilaginibacter sp. PPCGB 2223]|uniref:FkbM family methyltransferase n=1 Tax=Mucilaginibacter sp. PPCGB 2223 TaxID=1886027 RepID=UPI000825EAA7|nr:FkbM family methyltransferase [Mucilaginibacter sp. PPCGB 2223]OCX54038.1 hypothetical protein BEL04_07120 [Mucilaginibacter sp. PPCGB 2223]